MSVVKVNTYEIGVNNDLTNVVQNVDANRLGTDLSHIVWSGSAFVVKTGSIVEANGSLYVVQADIGIGNSTGFLTFNSATLAFSIVDTSRTGKYDAGKSGYYNSATVRILKWRTTAGGSHGIFNNNIGQNPDPTSNRGLAIGQVNTAIGDDAQAVGARNTANGAGSITYGNDNISEAGGTSLGDDNRTSNGVSVGAGNKTQLGTGPNAGVGIDNIVSGLLSSSSGIANKCGQQSPFSSASRAAAHGYNNLAFSDNSSAFGVENQATADSASAHGLLNVASGLGSVASGGSNVASGLNSTAMGQENTASATDSTSMGANCISSGLSSASLGNGCKATAQDSFSSGIDSEANGMDSAGVGIRSKANGLRSGAFGVDLMVRTEESTALGYGLEVDSYRETAIGTPNSNIRIFNKGASNGSVYDQLEDLGLSVGGSVPCIVHQSKNLGSGLGAVNFTAHGFVIKQTTTTYNVYRVDSAGDTPAITSIKTIERNLVALGIHFILVDIAR